MTSDPVSKYTHESPTLATTSSQPTNATTETVEPDSCGLIGVIQKVYRMVTGRKLVTSTTNWSRHGMLVLSASVY